MAIEHQAGLQAPSAGKPGSSPWVIFVTVAVGLFMSSIDSTIVAWAQEQLVAIPWSHEGRPVAEPRRKSFAFRLAVRPQCAACTVGGAGWSRKTRR